MVQEIEKKSTLKKAAFLQLLKHLFILPFSSPLVCFLPPHHLMFDYEDPTW